MNTFSIFKKADRQILLAVFYLGFIGLNGFIPSLLSENVHFLGDTLTPLAQWIWYLIYNSFLLFFATWYGLFMADEVDRDLLQLRKWKDKQYWRTNGKPVVLLAIFFGLYATVISFLFHRPFSFGQACFYGMMGTIYYQLFLFMTLVVLLKLLKKEHVWITYILVGIGMSVGHFFMDRTSLGTMEIVYALLYYSVIGTAASWVVWRRGFLMGMLFQTIAFIIPAIFG